LEGTGHKEVVRTEFSRQAASFEDPSYSFGDPRLTQWILEHVPVESGWTVLDVAGGTGHLARAVAPQVRQVVVLDLTRAMLEHGKSQTDAAGLENVLFEQGDAAALPYLDCSFDLVASRFAIHHFEAPQVVVDEMARVCRFGGSVAAIDLVSSDPALGDEYNRLERLRDPSHTTALTADALHLLLEHAGLRVAHTTSQEQVIDVERWLSQAATAETVGERIRAGLRDELEGGPSTGMRPVLKKGRLCYRQQWMIFVAERANK
jgi:ubiquinone/menaquinone biosynthesis C-methylase UbiE